MIPILRTAAPQLTEQIIARIRTEVDMLWRLLRFYLRRELADLHRNGIRLQASGRIDALPARATTLGHFHALM